MNLFDPDPNKRWLFVFTHPDDELAIAAWVHRLASRGIEVSAAWSVANAVREGEARNSMRDLGVRDDALFFFEYPDGNACEHLVEMTESFRSVIGERKPTDIVVCAFECGHLDHDSTNFAVCTAAAATGARILEYPLYHTYLTRFPILNRFADAGDEEQLPLTKDERKLKWKIARNYPSQNIASLLIWYRVAGAVGLRPSGLRERERLRLRKETDYLSPSLPPKLATKVVKSPKWGRWVRCVRNATVNLQSEATS